MNVEHHPLIKEFPELRDRLHAMKADAHFTKINDAYEALDKEIVRLEEGLEHSSDADLESLKKQRLQAKDTLYALLTA